MKNNHDGGGLFSILTTDKSIMPLYVDAHWIKYKKRTRLLFWPLLYAQKN